MLGHEAAALAAIRAVYARPVHYTGAGVVDQEMMAIKSDTAASPFQGLEGRSREVNFEIARLALPGEPDKQNLIVDGDGRRWSVIDIDERLDIAAWVMFVEEAPPA